MESVKNLSNTKLIKLIEVALAELKLRMLDDEKKEELRLNAFYNLGGTHNQLQRTQFESSSAPNESDKRFALKIKAMLKKGLYIKADERARMSDIAKEHPVWVRSQGLPVGRSNSLWKAAKDDLSAPIADEVEIK